MSDHDGLLLLHGRADSRNVKGMICAQTTFFPI